VSVINVVLFYLQVPILHQTLVTADMHCNLSICLFAWQNTKHKQVLYHQQLQSGIIGWNQVNWPTIQTTVLIRQHRCLIWITSAC